MNFHNPAVVKMSDADLTQVIVNGRPSHLFRKDKISIYHAGPLNQLDAADIQSLVAYIRTLQDSKTQPLP